MSAADIDEHLHIIIDTIVREAQPEQVILFGSRLKGTARKESDYDFLVVMQEVENEREVSRRIYRALLDKKTNAAVDIVVVDGEILEQSKENPFYIYGQVLREGKLFYDHKRLKKSFNTITSTNLDPVMRITT